MTQSGHQPNNKKIVLLAAQESRIDSRIALRGNRILGGGQTSGNNIATPRDDTLAKTQSILLARAHNIICQRSASFGMGFYRQLGTGEQAHAASGHRFTAAVFYNLITTSHCNSIRGGARWKRCGQQAARVGYDGYKHRSE
jgi:hypothetical protein